MHYARARPGPLCAAADPAQTSAHPSLRQRSMANFRLKLNPFMSLCRHHPRAKQAQDIEVENSHIGMGWNRYVRVD
jgi:hypothetical protein